ncbi:MAG: type II/IV secretion system protein [Candidatus Pacebacteria bacterium]|nr:type II/IV secretion system protein [Candidatus Paceibacterota bacterium]MBP9840081.1 type II/IV secretion system protein [Candidatus Paceibacterota bacterium]
MAPLPFDTNAENAKLARFREEEEEDLARILSEKYGLKYADLRAAPIDAEALRLIPEAKARETEVAPVHKGGTDVTLAIRNPQNPGLPVILDDLKSRGLAVTQVLVSARSLEKAHARYAELSFAKAERQGVLTVSPSELSLLTDSLVQPAELRRYLEETISGKQASEVTKLSEAIFAAAFAMKASDIHLEPEEEGAKLRFRLDGALSDVFFFAPETYRFLNSRLKILAGLKLNVHDRAQDGRFTAEIGTSDIEIRASAIPGNYGESFVMRLLDPSAIEIGLESLGIHPKLLARLTTEIKRPTGMLLTTGPTGSGKTTTLYAFLKKVQSPDVKIITIEDPVEYHLPGIVQTQANGKDYTFAGGLRSIVRQDPDVIMVGEIRDAETAGVAIQAALTGHFVFSTIHTNDAAGTFPRLSDLGVDSKEFGSAITVAMAQRLVRKLDPETSKQVELTGDNKTLVDRVLASIMDKTLIPENTTHVWVPDPTTADQTGYRGRVGLYEAIFMDDKMATFLRDNPSASDIRKEAARQGYITMLQDGVLKALAGLTSLEEVLSVADIPRD